MKNRLKALRAEINRLAPSQPVFADFEDRILGSGPSPDGHSK